MSDQFQNTTETEGREAFASGLGLDANPYSFLDGRWNWSTGWFHAREESLQQWMLKHART